MTNTEALPATRIHRTSTGKWYVEVKHADGWFYVGLRSSRAKAERSAKHFAEVAVEAGLA